MTTAEATRPTWSEDPNAYARWVRRQRAYGRWQPFADAQPARAHLLHVMATTGRGFRQLADEAGIPRSTVNTLLYGNHGKLPTRITRENAQRIFALRVDHARPTSTPAIGTQRRIHVLMGEGWPQVHLGPHFDIHPHYVNALLKVERVSTATAQAVEDAYQRLRHVDPLTSGVTAHSVSIAKGIAARNNWHDRLFWEDVDRIDDPNFDPKTVLVDVPRYMQLGEDSLWLMDQGYNRQQIGERLGVHPDYITVAVKKYREATAGCEQVGAAA